MVTYILWSHTIMLLQFDNLKNSPVGLHVPPWTEKWNPYSVICPAVYYTLLDFTNFTKEKNVSCHLSQLAHKTLTLPPFPIQ